MTLFKVANCLGWTNAATITAANTGSGDAFATVYTGNTGGASTLTADNTHAIHTSHTLAYKHLPTTVGTDWQSYWTWSSLSTTDVWLRGYLFFTALPSVGFDLWRGYVGSTQGWGVGFDSAGKLRLRNNASTDVGNGTVAVTTGAWCRVAAHIHHATTSTISAQLYQGANLELPATTSDFISPVNSTLLGASTDIIRHGISSNNHLSVPFWTSDVALSKDADPVNWVAAEASGGSTSAETTTSSATLSLGLGNGQILPMSYAPAT